MPQRYDAHERQAIATMFLLSGLYCLVAIIFLLIFGTRAYLADHQPYALLLLSFAGATGLGYLMLWYTGKFTWGGHFAVCLMGVLSLMLLITGGEQGTGPIWYLVFPVLATFVQGRVAGIVSVVVLLAVTLGLLAMGVPDYPYSDFFIQRLLSVYLALSVLAYLFASFRYTAEQQLKEINRQLEVLTNTDKISGLLNRRGMEAELEKMLHTFNRFKMPFTVVVFDIDDFKAINDQHGHIYGDFVIQSIGELCRSSIRNIDHAARWGGEEFLLLLPGTSVDGAVILAERLREKIHTSPFVYDGITLITSASFGVCQHIESNSLEDTIACADKQMYSAKQEGKNRVVSKN